MKLKHELKQVIFVNRDDLESLIFSEYGINYDICNKEQEDVDSIIMYGVYKVKLDSVFLKKYEIGNSYFILHRLMWDLCYKEMIDEGRYIIKL